MAPVIACDQCRRLTEERDRLRRALEVYGRAIDDAHDCLRTGDRVGALDELSVGMDAAHELAGDLAPLPSLITSPRAMSEAAGDAYRRAVRRQRENERLRDALHRTVETAQHAWSVTPQGPECETLEKIALDARAALAGEASGDGEAFCACGRRVSECDGSRAACPTPEKAREP